MGYNFPDSPTVGQVFNNWTWDGTIWKGGPLPLDDAPIDGKSYVRRNALWTPTMRVLQKFTFNSGTTFSRAATTEAQMSDVALIAPVSPTSKVFAQCWFYATITGNSLAVDDVRASMFARYYNGSAYAGGIGMTFGEVNKVTVPPSVVQYHANAFPITDVSTARVVGGQYDSQILVRLGGMPDYPNLTLATFSFACHFEEVE